jgi:hypothetical protein
MRRGLLGRLVLAGTFLGSLVGPASFSAARGRPSPPGSPRRTEPARCGGLPPPGAGWFYLGDPGDHPAAADAGRALRALTDAFGGALARDPACLHVEILDDGGLAQRYHRLAKRGPKSSIVGFHTSKLGADSTVFVVPQPGQGLDVVIVHEVLHALSHRFSLEAQRRRLDPLVEGATEYLTRELAEASLGIRRRDFKTGYGAHLKFYTALVERIGPEGLGLLAACYLTDGYNAFERQVDTRLGISLRAAGRALQADDLAVALQRLSAGAARDAGAPLHTSTGGL